MHPFFSEPSPAHYHNQQSFRNRLQAFVNYSMVTEICRDFRTPQHIECKQTEETYSYLELFNTVIVRGAISTLAYWRGRYVCMCAHEGQSCITVCGLRVPSVGPPTLGTMPPTKLLSGIPTVSTARPGSNTMPPISLATAASSALATITSVAPSVHSTTPPTYNSQDSAAAVCNLLPSLGQLRDLSGSAGIYVGEGLLPVPAKLAEKITRWEFMDMAELLSKFWSPGTSKEREASPTPTQATLPPGFSALPHTPVSCPPYIPRQCLSYLPI